MMRSFVLLGPAGQPSIVGVDPEREARARAALPEPASTREAVAVHVAGGPPGSRADMLWGPHGDPIGWAVIGTTLDGTVMAHVTPDPGHDDLVAAAHALSASFAIGADHALTLTHLLAVPRFAHVTPPPVFADYPIEARPAAPVEPDGERPHGSEPDTCPPCRRKAGRPAPRATGHDGPSRPFDARHAGDCTVCSFPIEPGQSIRRVGGGYAHAHCTEDT